MAAEGYIEVSQAEPEDPSTQGTTINEEGKISANTTTNDEKGSEEVEGPRKKQKSSVWDSFERLPKEQFKDGELRAKCKYCNKPLKCDPVQQGTSGLLKHLQTCNRNPNRANKAKQSLLASTLQEGSRNLTHHVFDQEQCRLSVAKFVIMDEMPFRVVEGEGFKQMMMQIEPRFQIPSRSTVTRDCLRLFMQESIKLKRYFKKTKLRVSLTTDTWTSCQNANYMCLTAHWIDEDWTYQKRILNFCVVDNHKGETIALTLERCLLAWNIEKVYTITVDNAASNDNAVGKLKEVLRHWNGLICDGDFLHLRCCAHILNLIVSDGVKELHSSVEGIRNAVRYVRSSPSRLKKFKEFVENMKIDSKSLLTLDCPTRWNSIYLMLESAIKFSSVFERMVRDDKDYQPFFTDKRLVGPPSKDDFRKATEFVDFLKVFYDMTLHVSGSLHVTSNECFQQIAEVYVILKEKANDHSSLLSIMAENMLSKYEMYWGNLGDINPLLMVGMILDPRYKTKYLQYAFEVVCQEDSECVKMNNMVTNVLYRLYDHYLVELQPQSHSQPQPQPQPQCPTQSQTSESITSSTSSTSSRRSRWLKMPIMKRFVDGSEAHMQLEKYAEIDRYLKDELVQLTDDDFDVLLWWKLNGSIFKVLSLIARDVFAIPVSTVSSESAFSTGGRVINEYRSSLSPKTVEALICTQSWISASILCAKLKGLQIDNFNDTQDEEQAESTTLNMSYEDQESTN